MGSVRPWLIADTSMARRAPHGFLGGQSPVIPQPRGSKPSAAFGLVLLQHGVGDLTRIFFGQRRLTRRFHRILHRCARRRLLEDHPSPRCERWATSTSCEGQTPVRTCQLPAPKDPPMTTVNFGTLALDTAATSFAPSLAMPPASTLEPTMKPVMFCKNTKGMPRCEHNSTK